MKKLHFLLFASILLFTQSCLSLRGADYNSRVSVNNRIPRLGVQVHERSFIEAFDEALWRENVLSPTPNASPWSIDQVTDVATKDVFRLFQNEVFDNITVGDGPRYGNARFKLMFYQRRNSGWGYLIPSYGTFFVANVLGMPFKVYRSEVDLQLEITDAAGKVVKRYSAIGVGKGKVAMYHGYVQSDATRKANLEALKDALNKIKQDLRTDSDMLSEHLLATGVLPKKE